MVKSKKEEVPYLLKKQKSYERPTNQTLEGLKRTLKKEDLEKQKFYKHLQEAMEEINRKAALEQIQKRVARREKLETGTTEEPGSTRLSQGSITSSSGTGTRSRAGTGPGGAGSPTGGSPWGSPFGGSSALESKLNDYYNMIWAKIKKEWTLPGDLPKGKMNIEAVIVVVIERNGKIQKSWFEKTSGNAQYDQMAMRAIKKAEPLPPIPREFSDDTFEIGIRFHPD
jgi:TonB family protein